MTSSPHLKIAPGLFSKILPMSWLAEMRRGGSQFRFTLLMLNWDERELFQQLEQTYTPDADAFCDSLVQKLELAAERHTGDLCEFHFFLIRWYHEPIVFSIEYGRCCFPRPSV
jgi:hypothetical protein